MIKNYLISAFNSLRRRKWISLLTLLSISLSLVMVTCITVLWNMLSAPLAPETNKDRTFFLTSETRLKSNNEEVWSEMGSFVLTPDFFFNQIYNLETPEKVTAFKHGGGITFYKKGREKYMIKYITDHNFFQVFDFDIIKGKSYKESDNLATIPLCMISENFAMLYFESVDCIGKIIEDRDRQYKVSGIYKKPASVSTFNAEIYVLRNPETDNRTWDWWDVAFLCHSKNDKAALESELKHIGQVRSQKHKKYSADLYLETSADKTLKRYVDDSQYLIYIGLLLIVLILPALCLIDILRNYIADKGEELAIRKAFGATRKKIRSQLIFENLLLTVLGGFLGLTFSYAFFLLMSDYNPSEIIFVFFDWRAILYYLLVFLIIGFIAGMLPAYRLSKSPIVNSLKNS